MDDGRCVQEAKESEDHDHACDTATIVSEHLKPHIIFVGRRRNETKCHTYRKYHNWFVCPLDKSIKMTSYPSSKIKEQEKPPRRNTQETKKIDNQQLITC